MPVYKTNGSAVLTIGVNNQGVCLGATQQANRVDIQALPTNVGLIYVGDGSVQQNGSNGGVALGVSKNGQGLNVGDVYSIEMITSLVGIFINGAAGDGVSINWWIGSQ